MNKPYGYIYKIVCKTSGKIYIGQTINSLKIRLRCHYYDSKKENLSTKIGAAFRKYGRDDFFIIPLCRANSKEELDHREEFCIALFNSVKMGYNIRPGGNGSKHSEETKTKMSIHRKGMPKPEGFGGKISKALKGKKHSESHRLNNIKAQKACQAHHEYRHSEETKKKMSEAMTGIPKSEEHRKKIGDRTRGTKASNETKKKMSIKRQGRKPNLGKITSEETKKKISEGLLKSSAMDKCRTKIFCENNRKQYGSYREAEKDLGITKGAIASYFNKNGSHVQGFRFKRI